MMSRQGLGGPLSKKASGKPPGEDSGRARPLAEAATQWGPVRTPVAKNNLGQRKGVSWIKGQDLGEPPALAQALTTRNSGTQLSLEPGAHVPS